MTWHLTWDGPTKSLIGSPFDPPRQSSHDIGDHPGSSHPRRSGPLRNSPATETHPKKMRKKQGSQTWTSTSSTPILTYVLNINSNPMFEWTSSTLLSSKWFKIPLEQVHFRPLFRSPGGTWSWRMEGDHCVASENLLRSSLAPLPRKDSRTRMTW